MQIWFLRRFPTALIALLLAWTGDLGCFAGPRAGRFRCGTALRALSGWHSRTLDYRLRSLRGPESVFASEATKAGQILRARLQQTLSCWLRSKSPGSFRLERRVSKP